MFCLFIFIVLYLYIVNYLLPLILNKRELDSIIFNNVEKYLLNKISCISGYHVVISKNNRTLDISLILRDNKFLKCEDKIINTDILYNCGNNGSYAYKTEPCNLVLYAITYFINN